MVRSASVIYIAVPEATALLGVSSIKLAHTFEELTLKNIPSASPPNSLPGSVFDFPKRFLNAIAA